MGSFRILVVEADSTALSAIEAALSHRYEVRGVLDARQALATVERWEPDLLILDPDLPGTDGYRLVRTFRTRADGKLMPAIFLTSRREGEAKLKGFRLSADEFIPKPVNSRELEIRVAAFAKQRKATGKRSAPKSEEPGGWSVNLSAMRGRLEQIGLPTVMTILEMERKSGLLVIAIDGQPKGKARVEFREGKVMRAWIDGRATPRNAELVYQLLGPVKGRFDFRPRVVISEDEVGVKTSTLILEGARRRDETYRPPPQNRKF